MLHRGAYCARCGWNARETSAKLRANVVTLLGLSAIGLLLMFLAMTRGKQGWSGALVVGVPFFFLPLALVVVARMRLSRIARGAVAQTNHYAEPPDPSTPVIADPGAERFRYLSRPRTVTMNWKGRLYSFAILGCTAFTFWLGYLIVPRLLHPAAGSLFTNFLGVGALCWWLWGCFTFFRDRIRERNLFVSGELATGAVLSRSEGRHGPYIVYGFQPGSGGSLQTRCRDYSNDQFEEMSLHVFYDPIDASKNAALESSLFRIR